MATDSPRTDTTLNADDTLKQTVFIVDDDEDVRDSLAWLLEGEGLEVRCFDSAIAFLDGYPAGAGGCILMDVRMPGLSGIGAQQKLADRAIQLPLIMISAHGTVDTAVTAMTQGALTFLEKPFRDQTLIDQVNKALLADREHQQQAQRQSGLRSRYDSLTKREKQLLERVVQGMSNQEMADDLGINRKTVEGHRANLMRKMDADSLASLLKMAVALDVLGD